MEILLHDPMNSSAAAWARFHAFRRARSAESAPGDPVISDSELEAASRDQSPNYLLPCWLAVDSGDVVGSLTVRITRPGSPDHAAHGRFAYVDLEVLEPWRRRGIATRLTAQLHRVMCEEAREILTTGTDEADGHAVLQHMGASDRLPRIESRLEMNEPDWPSLARMKTAVLAVNPELKLEAWRGRLPREVYEPLLGALTELVNDVPSGQLEWGGANINVSNIEESYRRMEQLGGVIHHILLRTPAGSLAGCTEAVWVPWLPQRCRHNFTGVHRAWRGRKLAQALKIAILQQVREAHPEVIQTDTQVAAQNAPMLAVNAKLGFRPRKTHGTYQLERDQLGAWLAHRVDL